MRPVCKDTQRNDTVTYIAVIIHSEHFVHTFLVLIVRRRLATRLIGILA